MHSIYRTKAFVLNSFPFGEGDKQLLLLTQEYGMIRANAQGIRKKESKLRQSVQEYSMCNIALVHGKTGWRLTNALFEFNIFTEVKNEDLKVAIARVLDLISRLVVGEGREDEIFDIVYRFVRLAIEKIDVDVSKYEAVFLLNILNKLGYVDVEPFRILMEENNWQDIKEKELKEMTMVINRGIRESGLLK
jgi:DNA repair protein RecO